MSTDPFHTGIQEAINLARNGKISESRAILESLSRSDKKNTQVLMVLAELYSKTGELKNAEQSYQKVLTISPDNAHAHASLGKLFHGQGKLKGAESCYRESLKLDNNQPVIHFNLGSILLEKKLLDEAASQYQQAIKINPQYAKAYANLGYIKRKQGLLKESIASYHKALEFAPDSPEIYFNLGGSQLELGLVHDAEQSQRKALQLKRDYVDAWVGLGGVQLFRDDAKNAIESYKRALSFNPQSIGALCGYAKALDFLGMREQAVEKIEQALLIESGNNEVRLIQGQIFLSMGDVDGALHSCKSILGKTPDDEMALILAASIFEKKGFAEKAFAYLQPLLLAQEPKIEAILSFASICAKLGRADEAIEMIEKAISNNPNLQPSYRRHLQFSLGKIYDDQGRYEKAFESYKCANALKRAKFNITDFRNGIDAICEVFSKEFIASHKSGAETERPVFILGMPRSGTSLVEQIIASHPDVFGAGELPDITNITRTIQSKINSKNSYPECVGGIKQQQLDSLANMYTDHLDEIAGNALRITDKMPTNFRHIGLIKMLFPNAHIIHCIRDPLDTCLSCYFQDFGSFHPWIYDLNNLGDVYQEYLRIMNYWQHEVGIAIYDVKYEELVENQEAISKELIDYIGLSWDESCMQFHKNKRFIWTASYDQVRKPLYKQSVARWKNYQPHIKPLINRFKTR